MTAFCKVKTFTKPTGNGNQSITGIGFVPKVLIFSAAKSTVDSTIQTTHAAEYHGFATASEGMSQATCSLTTGSGGPESATSLRDAHCLHFISSLAADLGKATLVSMDADGFTLNWSSVDANAYIINVMALGGSDLSNAKIMSFTKPTGAGPNDYTGFGFDPTAIIMLHAQSLGTIPGNTTFYAASRGFADSASNEWAFTNLEVGDALGGTQSRACRGNKTSNIWAYVNSTPIFSYEGNLSAYITDGFRISTTTTNATAAKFIALGLRGFQTKAGIMNKSTNTSVPVAQAVTGAGFRPIGLLTGNDSFSVSNTTTNDVIMSHGMSDGTTHLMAAAAIRDALAAVPAKNRVKNSVGVHCMSNVAATTAEGTIALDSDGFTVTWTTNDVNANRIGYFAIGPAVTPIPPVKSRATVVW